jgi:opacity protein-like surface antigen
MIKRRLIVVLSVILFPGIAFALDRAEIWIGGNLALPQRPDKFKDHWKTGHGYTFGLGYYVTPRLIVGFSEESAKLPANAEKSSEKYQQLIMDDLGMPGGIPGGELTIDASGGYIRAVSVSTYVRYMLTSQGVRPYVMARAGLVDYTCVGAHINYTVSAQGLLISDGKVHEDLASDTAFKLGFGAGMNVPIGKQWELFIESAYDVGFTRPVAAQLTGGESRCLSSVSANAGLRWVYWRTCQKL